MLNGGNRVYNENQPGAYPRRQALRQISKNVYTCPYGQVQIKSLPNPFALWESRILCFYTFHPINISFHSVSPWSVLGSCRMFTGSSGTNPAVDPFCLEQRTVV